MTTRPTASPAFATDATQTSGAETGLVPRLDPGSGFKLQGWYPNTRMPARWFNFLLGIVGDWILYLTQKTDGAYSPLNFAGVGDGSANDTTALQNCFNAAAAASAEGRIPTVDLGGKAWRINAKLLGKPAVNVKNGRIVMDHATESLIDFDTALAGVSPSCVWENVQLDFAQANSGVMLTASVPGVSVAYKNCRFNDSALGTGRLLFSNAGSDFRFDHCRGRIPLNSAGFRSDAGVLEIEGGRYSTPLGYADSIVEGTGGTHRLTGVHFVTSSSTGGNAVCVNVAGQKVIASGCLFDDGSSGNGNTAFASSLGLGVADLQATGNQFRNMNSYALSAALLLGCTVELRPYGAASSNGTTAIIPANRQTFTQRFTTPSTTPPSLTVDPPLFAGQVLHLMVANDHTDAWVGNLVFSSGVSYDDADPALANLAANSSVRFCATLVAHYYEGTIAWVMTHQKQVVLI